MLAKRVNEIETSTTTMIFAEAKKLRAKGINIIDLSVGEPDFNTPNNIKEAGKSAIEGNKTKYTFNEGTVELRNAIIAKLKRDNQLDYKLNEIIVSSGAKQGVFNAIFALVNPGDEVIISSPYWVSYPSMVSLAGGKSVIIDTDENTGFKITPEQLSTAVSSKTKLLILCNPSNPTGTVYTIEELKALAEIVKRNNFYVISDEIYEKLIYDDLDFISFASLDEGIKKRTILVNGLSKSFAMTGWRIGYAAASEEIISAMNRIQSHTTSHASTISQQAAVEAIVGPQNVITEMLSEFNKRREYLLKEISNIGQFTCYKPHGAFYLFPNISKYLHRKLTTFQIENSHDFVIYLLNEAHVATVPGSAFGSEGYLRISYSTSMDNLQEAISRLKTTLK